MSKSKATLAREAAERQEAIEYLRKVAPPGTRIYGIEKHVSRSGMMRHIEFYAPVEGEHRTHMAWLTGYFDTILRWGRANDGIKVGGCGMNMVFHTVYSAASAVWHGTPEAEQWEKDHPRGGASAGYMWDYESL